MTTYPDTFAEWFRENLGDYARDIARYGADNGFPGISYTSGCTALFDRYAGEMWKLVTSVADGTGYQSMVDLLRHHARADMADSWSGYRTLLVWVACESLAQTYPHTRPQED